MTKHFAVLLAVIVLISGCGIFETRQPQPPQQGRTDFLPPTSPDIVIQNLVNSIADRNVDNYIACLSDTSFGARIFTFVPPADVYNQYRSIFFNWDKNSERAYFNNFISQSLNSSSSALILSSENLTFQGDSATYNANYTLLWPNKVPGYPQQAQGNLQFSLGIDRNQNWSIYRWIDSRVGDSLTWSEMKARFSQ